MMVENDAQKLAELVRQIEDYLAQGSLSPARHDEVMAMIDRAEAVFDKIVARYISSPEKPSVVEAYNVSELQERLHRAKDSLHFSPAAPEHAGTETYQAVTIYTAPGCPWCRQTREYLAQKGIAYIEHDIARDRAKADEMIEKSGQTGVPVIIIGDQTVVGFDQTRLDSLLS